MMQYVLVDKVRGFLSDFADETVYSVFRSPDEVVEEIHARMKTLKLAHVDLWGRRALSCFPRKAEIRRLVLRNLPVRMTSIDKCVYTWSMHKAV